MGFTVSGVPNRGVNLQTVHETLTKAMRKADIVDQSQVFMVLDDETLPPSVPSSQRYITVRLPLDLSWQDGDVFAGDNVGTRRSQFIALAQTRISLWLSDGVDLYGTGEAFVAEATSAPPAGNSLLDSMMRLFWEQHLIDAEPWVTRDGVTPEGDFILMRPMKFVGLEGPKAQGQSSRANFLPFRFTWEVKFTWDLTITNA